MEDKRQPIFERLLRPERDGTALLIVDMQKGFMLEGSAMEVPPAWDLVPRIAGLADLCRSRGIPVVYLEYLYSPKVPILLGELHPEHKQAAAGAATGYGFPSNVCLEGDESVDTIDELAPKPDELVVRKHWYDGFSGTPLDGALRAMGVKTLVVTGIMTDICVLATVIGAFAHEYKLIVASDGTATLWDHIQEATLDIIRRAYARVLPVEQIEQELRAL